MKIGKRLSYVFVILIIGLAFASGIVSAEYLGPNRVHPDTTTEVCEVGVWAEEGEHCFDINGDPSDCIICHWECSEGSACGSATYSYSTGTEWVTHTVMVTDPSATVNSTTNCATWGDASWCLEPASVTIIGFEPMPGKYITLIEGTQNSDPFACPGDTCTVNMLEGSNALAYWALSDYGDSSLMGTTVVLQDTIAPEINASVTGTMGENGWFVSDATLSVVFSDASPGSGLAMTSALFNAVLTDVSVPVTLPEGVYNIQLDTRDTAGWTATTAQTVYVDTTAPALTANQPPTEVDVYMNGSVVFSGTSSDATSGVNRIEVATDGSNWHTAVLNADGTWTLDWNSDEVKDGTYTPLVAAYDNAGNRTDITLQPITLDNSAPAMSITGGWYIWESGHIVVYDSRAGIEHIELSVRDEQNRWPAREWYFDREKLEMDLQWDRKFGDGTIAPIGDYQVLLQAWDKLGNGRWISGRIYIPEAGATPVIPLQGVISAGVEEIPPTPTPLPDEPEQDSGVLPVVPVPTEEPATATPEPTQTPAALIFSSAPIVPADGDSKSTPLPVDPNLLTGAAALAAAASATAYSLFKREEAEAARKRAAAQSKAEAMAKVRASEATKVRNYLNKLANDAHIEKLKRQTSAAISKVAGFIGLQERTKIENDLAKAQTDYSTMAQSFRAGEAASIANYEEYKAYHDKLTKVEEFTGEKNVITPNDSKTVSSPMPGIAASVSGVDYSGKSVFTPDDDLQELIDANIAKQVEEKKEKYGENPLLGWFFQTIEPFISWIDDKSSKISARADETGIPTEEIRDELIDPLYGKYEGMDVFVNDYVYLDPYEDPAVEVPLWMKEAGFSMIPIIGDGSAILKELYKKYTTGEMDELNYRLSIIGLAMDSPLDVGFAGDTAVAILKGFSAMIPSGPARQAMLDVVKQFAHNPEGVAAMAGSVWKLLGKEDLLKILNNNPKLLKAVLEGGSEAAEELVKHEDELIQLGKAIDGDTAKAVLEGGSEVAKNTRNLLTDFDSIVDEIVDINKQYDNGLEIHNSISSIVHSATYYDDPYEQIAAIGKGISAHAFENGNKRTAFDTMKKLMSDMNLDCPLADEQIWEIVYDISSKDGLSDIGEIALRLQGK
ncbi:MAG: Ig-like domain repeat protein [Anaerolineaceae bacterium]|nr:Ig-like domain repeat protein [Anaerolineaceae bacterium]